MIVDLLDNCERMTRIQRWMVITGVDFEFSGHDVVIATGFADWQTNLLNGQVH
jgi:hypothetical protein